MKQKLQGIIIGLLIGVLLTGSVAIAASTTTLYDVKVGGIKIVVDGKTLNPKDANGKRVEPMIYNGTTYLPVRAVGEAIGKSVYWDGPNYTVYLGKMNGGAEYPTTELEQMTSVDQRPNSTNRLTDNYGNTYSRAVWNSSEGYKMEFLLNMRYSRFKGTLYIPKGVSSDRSITLKIVADGKTIYTSPTMTKTSAPVDINVDVTGYNDVKIEFSDSMVFPYEIYACLGDAGFYQ